MIKVTSNTKKILVTTVMALLFSGCGSSGEATGYNKSLSYCENNSSDAVTAKAMLIPANSMIRKSSENTLLRVWHFQNSDEAACVLSGSAEIISTI